jgi:hypothetical protein
MPFINISNMSRPFNQMVQQQELAAAASQPLTSSRCPSGFLLKANVLQVPQIPRGDPFA